VRFARFAPLFLPQKGVVKRLEKKKMSLLAVTAVVVLDADGKRLCAKYYNNAAGSGDGDALAGNQTAQKKFEAAMFEKTSRSNSEILMWDGSITVYRASADVLFYVVGSADENELILMGVLSTFFETVSKLLQGQVDARAVLENLDYVLLALDEIVDEGFVFLFLSRAAYSPHGEPHGPYFLAIFVPPDPRSSSPSFSSLCFSIILESDPNVVVGRVSMRGLDAEGEDALGSNPNAADIVKSVREQLKRSLLQ
jgi:coatomer subunit zeta